MRTHLLAIGLLLAASFVAILPAASAACNIYSDTNGNCIGSGPGTSNLPSVCHAPCSGSPCVLQECVTSDPWTAYCVYGSGKWGFFNACVPV